MKFPWMILNGKRDVFRSPEDEGAGGASDYSGEGGSPAPDNSGNDRMSALESRIGEMAQRMSEMAQSDRARRAQEELRTFENTLEQRVASAKSEVTAAEAALADAYDTGDGVQIARAQTKLSEAVSNRDRQLQNKENYDLRRREEERRQGGGSGAPGTGGAQPQQQPDTTNLNAWRNRNRSWYGIDEEMTQTARDADARIRKAGAIPVGSTEYFEAIDRVMKQRHPDKFGGTPPTAGGGGGGSRPSNGAGGRVAQSVLDGWRRMGIDTSDPKTVERMIKHRSTLADKGILPAQPVNAPIKAY